MTTRLSADTDLATVTRLSLNNDPIYDNRPPALASSYDFVFNQKVDESFTLRFNESIKVGTGDIILSNGADTRIIDITDTGQITFENDEDHGIIGGKGKIRINPLNDLIPGTRYSVQMPDGVIQDKAGNAFEGIHDSETFSFNAITSNPLLDNTDSFNHRPIKIDQPIELSFDEPVTADNGFIVISNGIDTQVIDIHDTNQITFNTDNDANRSSVIIDPALDLTPDTEYSLWTSYGAITDLTGNPFLSASMLQPINFNTISSNPLLTWHNLQASRHSVDSYEILEPGQAVNTVEDISKLQPLAIIHSFGTSSGASPTSTASWFSRKIEHSVKINSNIALNFDEAVVAGNGNIIISNGTDTRTINIQDNSQVTFDDTGVTINPEADLLPDSTYTLQIAHGVIVDTKSNPYAGLNATDALSFTTIAANPILLDSMPWNEQSTFQVNDEIFLLFDESVFPGNGSIIIASDSDTRTIDIQDTNQVDLSGGIFIVVDPLEDLQPHTRYSIFVTDNAIQNADGNFFTGITDPETLNFTTIPDEPSLRLNEPFNVKFDGEIVLEFSETITASNGTIVVSNGSDTCTIDINDYSQITFNGENIIINPTTDLILNTQYSVQIDNGAITDNDGHTFPGITDTETLRFTTTDTEPLLQFSIPPDNFSGFMTNWNIGLDFDEDIMASNGTITLQSDTDTRLIDIHDADQVYITHDKIIVNPSNGLLPNTHYSVLIPPGTITDTAGNPYAGIEDLMALDFTTSDSAQVFEIF